MRLHSRVITASVAVDRTVVGTLDSGGAFVLAAGDAGQRIGGEAYLGGKMRVGWWEYPVVMDLMGMAFEESVPFLVNHENRTASRLGLVRPSVAEGRLRIDGEIVSTSGIAQGVIEQARAGAEWQLSIGAEVQVDELVDEGQVRVVNGREHAGPFYHVRSSRLREVSVVAVGADAATRMRLAASYASGGNAMTFDAWLKARGLDAATMTDDERKKFRAEYDSEQRALHAAAQPTTEPVRTATPVQAGAEDPAVVAQMAIETERRRVAGIQAECAGEFPEVERTAIAGGWTVERTRGELLTALRASRPTGVSAALRQQAPEAGVLEAALYVAGGGSAPEKQFSAQQLEAATKRYRHGIGLQQLLVEAARANGYTGSGFRDTRAILEHCFPSRVQASWSHADIPGILANTANKFLLEGFMFVERTWRSIAARRSVSDFKTVTSYRMNGGFEYELIPPGGEFQHGAIGEDSYTIKADTYGKMFAVTRQDIINDDLGALTAVPRRLGRGAALKLNDVFWTKFLDNAAFFTAARGNYFEGAATALSIDSLTEAEKLFFNQTDPDGKPLGAMPEILLVPPAQNVKASQFMNATEVRDTTASTKYATNNPHAGKFQVQMSAYLSNAAYSGYSATAWYLLANPLDMPVIEVAFLNGVENPTVEQTDADFNTLGILFRGYHDFGVALQEYRGGTKAKGAA